MMFQLRKSALLFLLTVGTVTSGAADEKSFRHRHLAQGETAMIYGARGLDCDMGFPTEHQLFENTAIMVDDVLVDSRSPLKLLPHDPTLGREGDGKQKSNSCGKRVPFAPVSFTVPDDAIPGTVFRVSIYGDEVRPIFVGGN